MKLVHFLQLLLFGVLVFGRAIEEQIADTRVVKPPYRFRYNVASQDSGDYKSQMESRDGDGVVTGMYQVLQPDGCVRVVHYTADAMGFHPTVTYEGDCQPVGSINTAAAISLDPSLKDVSAPINPSSAFLSRPVLSAVPGLINPLTTDVRDSTQEVFISRPSQQTVSQDSAEKFFQVLPAKVAATSLSQKMPGDIDSSGEPSRPVKTTSAGIAPTITSNENSAVRTQAQSEEIIVPSKLPTEGLSILTKRPVSDTQTVGKTQQQSAVLVVPQSVVPTVLLTGNVESSNTVPLSILSLFDTFEPTKKTSNKYEEVDPLEAQPSEFSERILKDESDSSVVVESAPEESDPVVEETIDSKPEDEIIVPVVEVQSDEPVVDVSAPEDILTLATAKKNEETIESKNIPEETKVDHDETAHEEDYSLKSTVVDETIQSKNVESVDRQTDETDSEKERSFSILTQSALDNVKNFTAPLTQLISSSVQNLTNPVTALLNTFNKNKLTTTKVVPPAGPNGTQVAPEPTTALPSSKIEMAGEIQDIPSEKLIVTDHHNEEKAFTAIDGAVSADIASASQHSKQTIVVSEDTPSEEAERILPAEEENLKKSIVQNLESISIEVNDPAATLVVVEPVPLEKISHHQDSAEPTVIEVSDSIPAYTPVSVADPVPADVAEGTLHHESSKVASLEETPIEQVEADVRETSSSNDPVENENVTDEEVDVIKENKEFYQVNDDEIVPSESYVSIAEPVIYSHQIATGPFYVTQPIGNPIRQATARAIDSVIATPYGLRVQNFVPTYATLGSAPPSYVYNQHRRQGYQTQPIQMHHYKPSSAGRLVSVATPIRSIKKQGEAYGMRNTNIQQARPTNSHYTVGPKAVKQPTWTPFYSTYVR